MYAIDPHYGPFLRAASAFGRSLPWVAGLGLFAFLSMSHHAMASSYARKTDNRIIALDVLTGKLLWEVAPKSLSDAHFEVYPKGLVVYPHYAGDKKTNPMYLHLRTGKKLRPFRRDARKRLARSMVFWPLPSIRLANGWRLKGFSPGNHKTFRFVDGKTGRLKWSLATGHYPHQVRVWKNTLFYAVSYLSKEGLLYAFDAGTKKPRWTVDLNRIVKGRKRKLTRMIFQVIDDVLYVDANEHIFAFRPKDGKLLWHRNLAKDLGLRFRPDFYGGALNLAVFAKAGSILVVSFERRVVAIDLAKGRYLWHMSPGTFPHTPYPVLHGKTLYLTAGKQRSMHLVKPAPKK